MHPTGPELPISAHVACARCMCSYVQLYVLRASHALVQATVGVGTVIIVYIGVAYTTGGVLVSCWCAQTAPLSEQQDVFFPSNSVLFPLFSHRGREACRRSVLWRTISHHRPPFSAPTAAVWHGMSSQTNGNAGLHLLLVGTAWFVSSALLSTWANTAFLNRFLSPAGHTLVRFVGSALMGLATNAFSRTGFKMQDLGKLMYALKVPMALTLALPIRRLLKEKGGGVRGREKNQPHISGPFDKLSFLPEDNFFDVGGSVGRSGLARAPTPAPGSLSNSLLPMDLPLRDAQCGVRRCVHLRCARTGGKQDAVPRGWGGGAPMCWVGPDNPLQTPSLHPWGAFLPWGRLTCRAMCATLCTVVMPERIDGWQPSFFYGQWRGAVLSGVE